MKAPARSSGSSSAAVSIPGANPGREPGAGPVTAYGVYRGIKACARYRYGSDTLQGKAIALQGCGSVRYHLAGVATDVDAQRRNLV
jgi:glutamate dehydrogenase/leucine dehydrogenase